MRSTATWFDMALRAAFLGNTCYPLRIASISTSNGDAVIFSAFKTYDTRIITAPSFQVTPYLIANYETRALFWTSSSAITCVTIYCCYDNPKRNRVRDKSLIWHYTLFVFMVCYVVVLYFPSRIEIYAAVQVLQDGFWGIRSASKLTILLTTLISSAVVVP